MKIHHLWVLLTFVLILTSCGRPYVVHGFCLSDEVSGIDVVRFPGGVTQNLKVKNDKFTLEIATHDAKATSYVEIYFNSNKYGPIKYQDGVFQGRELNLFFEEGRIKAQVLNTGYP